MIPYGRQDISQADVAAVTAVLNSDFLTQGPTVGKFEEAVARRVRVGHAVAVSNGTSALHIACMALGLGPGDWLWTSPITFVASANCGLYCGAKVDFVDIDPHTYNLCPIALERKLQWAERQGCLPKIVVPVHLAGQPCDMKAIQRLARTYGFRIIEDASHAIGGEYRGEPIGCGRYSDVTVFSFHPVKIITTGEGGMTLTNDEGLARRMARLRSHGISRDPDEMTEATQGPWYYQQLDLGYNYRMTDLQAALGLSQLERLAEFVERRRQLAQRYNTLLGSLPVVVPWQHADGVSPFHLYIVRLQSRKSGKTRRQVFDQLRDDGIGVNLHYIPVYAQPYFRQFGFQPNDFPEAEAYYSDAITLPMFPALEDEQQVQVVEALGKALVS